MQGCGGSLDNPLMHRKHKWAGRFCAIPFGEPRNRRYANPVREHRSRCVARLRSIRNPPRRPGATVDTFRRPARIFVGPITVVAEEESRMLDVVKTVRRFLVSEDGPTAVEYGVLLALIIAVSATIISSVGSQVSTSFNEASSSMAS
jgi:pilus assembly protein Flp/PilA